MFWDRWIGAIRKDHEEGFEELATRNKPFYNQGSLFFSTKYKA